MGCTVIRVIRMCWKTCNGQMACRRYASVERGSWLVLVDLRLSPSHLMAFIAIFSRAPASSERRMSQIRHTRSLARAADSSKGIKLRGLERVFLPSTSSSTASSYLASTQIARSPPRSGSICDLCGIKICPSKLLSHYPRFWSPGPFLVHAELEPQIIGSAVYASSSPTRGFWVFMLSPIRITAVSRGFMKCARCLALTLQSIFYLSCEV